MYKFIQILIVLTFGIISVSNAQILSNQLSQLAVPNDNQLTVRSDIPSQAGLFEDSKSEKIQALTYRTLVFNRGQANFGAYSNSTPIAYDPGTNMIFITSTDYSLIGNSIDKMPGKVYFSGNMGNSWDTLTVFDEGSGIGIMNMSIAINNQNQTSSLSELPFTILGSLMLPAPSGGWSINGLVYVHKKGNSYLANVNENPDNNNPGKQYLWSPMKFKSMHNSPYSFAAGLNWVTANSTVQAGSYGCFVTDMNAENENYYQSIMPAEWNASKFRVPTQGLNYRSTSPMEIAVDDDGNFYAGVCNEFLSDLDNRVPGVSKSDDFGDSWSNFNSVPTSLLEQYRQKEDSQYPYINVYNPYNSTFGLVTLGNDNYSFFFTLAFSSEDGANDIIRRIDLVEAKFSQGTWTLSKVYEFQGVAPYTFTFSKKYTDQGRWDVLELDFAALGYEIQASKTKDADYLIVKFIDMSFNKVFPSSILITYDHDRDDATPVQDIQLDNIDVMDVFIATRKVGESTWKVKNVTEDTLSQKGTWIPDIVPSVTQIPFFWAQTGVFNAPPHNAFNTLPNAMRDRLVDLGYGIQYATITNALEVSVDEPVNHNFNVFSVYPNPVTDMAEFTFELNKPANVRIEITNALGQIVKVVYDNYTSEGLQGFNADLSDLSNGVYYYTLTAGSQSATKVLNVIK